MQEPKKYMNLGSKSPKKKDLWQFSSFIVNER